MKKNSLPLFLKSCFWEVDFPSLNTQKDAHFIVKRLLDRGDTKAIKWLLSVYPKTVFQKVVLTAGNLSPESANFWADIFGLDKAKIKCLQKPYSRTPFGLSS